MDIFMTFQHNRGVSKLKEKLSSEVLERRKRVAYHIKRMRFARGLSTAEALAGELEMNAGYIRRLESGHAPFGSDMERRFAQFFGVDFIEFYRPIPESERDIEIEQLQEKIQALGGTEKIKQLSKIADALLGGPADERTREDSKLPPTPGSRKRTA